MTSSKCSADIHYDKTFVPLEDQRASEFTLLQPIIDSKCSPDTERFLCFTRLPPCTADTSVVHLPCQEFCERIDRDCGSTFREKKLPTLHCDYLFPQGDSASGLCNLTQWPAPWPWKIPEPPPPTSGKVERSKMLISLESNVFFSFSCKTKKQSVKISEVLYLGSSIKSQKKPTEHLNCRVLLWLNIMDC